MSAKQFLLISVVCGGLASCGQGSGGESVSASQEAARRSEETPVGLSLFFVNGEASPLRVSGSSPRFLQEIDLVDFQSSTIDTGMQPLIDAGPLAKLDWRELTQVEELWIPAQDGSFTRERYYRNARWMEQPSKLRLIALDELGNEVGPPVFVTAGRDDELKDIDDAFVRRFVARQSAMGCPAVGDCSGAVFVAEALVQLRDNLHPDQGFEIPKSARALRLTWTLLPERPYQVPLGSAEDEGAFAYGFDVTLEPEGAPENGQFYVPGEAVSFRVTFRDGEGNRLHAPGTLPTYADYFLGLEQSGLRYLDLTIQTRLHYALKHRESNLFAVLSGPTDTGDRRGPCALLRASSALCDHSRGRIFRGRSDHSTGRRHLRRICGTWSLVLARFRHRDLHHPERRGTRDLCRCDQGTSRLRRGGAESGDDGRDPGRANGSFELYSSDYLRELPLR